MRYAIRKHPQYVKRLTIFSMPGHQVLQSPLIASLGMKSSSGLAAFVAGLLVATPLAHAGECAVVNTQELPTVDMQRVRAAWLELYNSERSSLGLALYTLDGSLNTTAGNWSFYAVKRGYIDHKRVWNGAYYDYKKIEQWFAAKGLSFPNRNGTTYSESIGWNVFRCSKEDCTNDVIAALQPTFDFYMSEKTRKSRPHYNSIVNNQFTKMGLGIGIDSAAGKIYVTSHFATDVQSDGSMCR